MFVNIKEGDILMFRKPRGIIERGVDAFEYLEDGPQPEYYYHCAVAIDSFTKIEALSTIRTTRIIQDGTFDVFRPPLRTRQIHDGLFHLRGFLGERYDWLLIIDDAIRYATRDLLHLPENWIWSMERRRKVCSTVVAEYLCAAGYRGKLKLWPSPEDLYLSLKDYQVKAV